MIKKTNIALALATVSVVALGAFSANAAETVSTNASVDVLNFIDITKDEDLHFGTISVVGTGLADGGSNATITISELGVMGAPVNGGGATDDTITVIDPTNQQEAAFTIANSAQNTAINITLPGGALTLTPPSGTATFTVTAYTAGGPTVTTDGTGAATFGVGATLNTDGNVAAAYDDGTYTGAFDVIVAY